MIFIFLGLITVLVYLYLNYRLNYWNRKNVPFVPTSVYSSLVSLFNHPTPLVDHYAQAYDQLKGHRYGGSFQLLQPQFILRDPELIKQILVKDFEYFRDRGSVVFDKHDALERHLFSSPGDLWKGKFRQNHY